MDTKHWDLRHYELQSTEPDHRIQEFKDEYPQYANERFEICDNGTVFVHGNCAYPIIIKNAVESIGE